MTLYNKAVELIEKSEYLVVFTGAGISIESGIPTFRGENGLWEKYDMNYLTLDYFYNSPAASWVFNKKIFYETFEGKKPNIAHLALSQLENYGIVKSIITQNIDNMHTLAGSKNVIEFHGNARLAVCTKCDKKYDIDENLINNMPPKCEACNEVLKPDFIFFGESLDERIYNQAFDEAEKSDVVLVIGTTGIIRPASNVPIYAKETGAKIIEINTEASEYTNDITDIFINEKATLAMGEILKSIKERTKVHAKE
jgi:NAD-dependent deacetylase